MVTRGSFDYIQIPWYGALAGISQAENSEPGYGQGAEGYGKRLGAAFADGTIENYMTGAVLPSLLRQDPRFFQESQGGFVHRAGYAVSRIIITRSDSGHQQFNFSEVLGSAMSAAISTYSYHPKGDRNCAEHGQRVGNSGWLRHSHHRGERILARYSPQAEQEETIRVAVTPVPALDYNRSVLVRTNHVST